MWSWQPCLVIWFSYSKSEACQHKSDYLMYFFSWPVFLEWKVLDQCLKVLETPWIQFLNFFENRWIEYLEKYTNPECSTSVVLTILCRIRVISFVFPSRANIGLFCSTPGVALARAVPRKVAMEMLLTGEPINAEGSWTFWYFGRSQIRGFCKMTVIQ